MKEIEVKLRISDRSSIAHRLIELGWTAGERLLEWNFVYDRPDRSLRTAKQLLRVRDTNGRCTFTLKSPGEEKSRHKAQEELEVGASDSGVLQEILEGLGYELAWRYEKFRTSYKRDGAAGEILLDETPIGDFLELEGEPSWIDAMTVELGFSEQDHITANYGALFDQFRVQHPEAGPDMVFDEVRRDGD